MAVGGTSRQYQVAVGSTSRQSAVPVGSWQYQSAVGSTSWQSAVPVGSRQYQSAVGSKSNIWQLLTADCRLKKEPPTAIRHIGGFSVLKSQLADRKSQIANPYSLGTLPDVQGAFISSSFAFSASTALPAFCILSSSTGNSFFRIENCCSAIPEISPELP